MERTRKSKSRVRPTLLSTRFTSSLTEPLAKSFEFYLLALSLGNLREARCLLYYIALKQTQRIWKSSLIKRGRCLCPSELCKIHIAQNVTQFFLKVLSRPCKNRDWRSSRSNRPSPQLLQCCLQTQITPQRLHGALRSRSAQLPNGKSLTSDSPLQIKK